MKEIAGHKLSDSVLERLPAFTSDGRISYAQLRAVMNVIKEIDLVESIVKYAVNSARDSRIERDDFLDAASRASALVFFSVTLGRMQLLTPNDPSSLRTDFTRYSAFTPMEADVIFKLSSPKNDPKDRLRLSNFDQLFDPKWEAAEYEEPSKPALIHEIGKSAYHFVLGGVAGGIGAAAVYPIDMVCAERFVCLCGSLVLIDIDVNGCTGQDPNAEPAHQGRRRAAVPQLIRLCSQDLHQRGLPRLLPRPATAAPRCRTRESHQADRQRPRPLTNHRPRDGQDSLNGRAACCAHRVFI